MEEMGQLAWTLVIVIIIEGVWLAGLTYLMWRRHHLKKIKKAQEEQPSQST